MQASARHAASSHQGSFLCGAADPLQEGRSYPNPNPTLFLALSLTLSLSLSLSLTPTLIRLREDLLPLLP